MPGVYEISGSGACGSLGFSYALPIPPGVDCGTGKGPNCPPGCTSACSGFGCTPCTPAAPEVAYFAYAPSDCLGNSHALQGTWRVTITSATPYTGDGGSSFGAYYIPHGSVTATLVGSGGASDTAVLSVSF
jgi:hypothetical protein